MKPASYTELVTMVQDYIHRPSITSGLVDYFITEAEAEMNARLRTRRQLTALTPTISSTGAVTIPDDFGGWKQFTARDGSTAWDLDILTSESQWDIDDAYGGTGKPQAVVARGSTHQVWPYEDTTYTYRTLYYARIPNLTSGAPTNWVILNHPSCYMYGVLAASRGFIQDDARLGQFSALFSRAIDRVIEEEGLEKDVRSNAILRPNTSMFSGYGGSNIETDG